METSGTPTRKLAGTTCAIVLVSLLLVGATGCDGVWFTLVYADEFDGPTLDPRWSPYSGAPSSDPFTRWDPSLVSVRDGALVLEGRPRSGKPGYWDMGGVSNWRNAQTYGRWLIRYRAPASSVLSYHFLLWPQAEVWPPEIDIAEGFDRGRSRILGFTHWVDSTGSRRRESGVVNADFTEWNTLELTWRPGEIRWRLNKATWMVVTGDAVPDEPMWLALQAETQACDRSTVDCTQELEPGVPRIEIDRVVVSSYDETSLAG
jgi:beta-glucanase (GH16 family)